MPTTQLIDFQQRLAALRSCFALTEQELQTTPLCPHCSFRPVSEAMAGSASNTLTELDSELSRIEESWTKTLLSNLSDSTTRKSLELLPAERRKLVDGFIETRTLPVDLSQDFIESISEALTGLTKVVVKSEELYHALLAGGSPATLTEFERRCNSYLHSLARGKDPDKVRIVLE